MVQTFDQLGVTERRHGLIPAGAGTERIRLEPAIGRTVDAVVASSYDEEADLARLGIPRRPSASSPPASTPPSSPPTAPPTAATTGTAWSPSPTWPPSSESLTILLQAMANIPAAELVLAGGPARDDLRGDLPTAAWPSYPTPSTCTAGSSSPARSAGRPAAAAALGRPDGQRQPARGVRRSPPSRPWPAAPPSSRPPTAPTSTPSSTAPPASWSNPCRPAQLAQKIRALLAHPMQAPGVQRRRHRPRPLPLLLGPHRPRDPRRLRHRARRLTSSYPGPDVQGRGRTRRGSALGALLAVIRGFRRSCSTA